MDALTTLDILVLLMVSVLAVLGLVRGFVTEILSLLAWVAAVIALKLFFPAGAGIAANVIGSETGGSITAFVVIFFAAFILFRFVGNSLGNRTKKSIIGPIDRVLGFGFGAIKGLVLASLAFAALTLSHQVLWGSDEALPGWMRESRVAPLLDITSRAVIDYAKQRRDGASEKTKFEGEGEGYSDEERDALDALLKDTGGTEI